MRKKIFPVVSIILYVFAGALLIFTIWAASKSFDYIGNMIAMNQVMFKGSEFEIISFHMTNFGLYLVNAIILFALGWIVQVLSNEMSVTFDLEDEDVDYEELDEDDFEEVVFEDDSDEDMD